MLEAPFEVIEPKSAETPVIVEAPHAGLWLDAESAMWTVTPARSIARDADLYVDELFAGAPDHGATFLYARLSRYVVDLNRDETDYDGAAVIGGPSGDRPRGVIWRMSSDGLPVLRDAVPPREYERRMERFYRPYHAALRELIARKHERFGFCVVLCAHSMPTPRRHGRVERKTADIVPGTRGRTTAADVWINTVDDVARSFGWEIHHDRPYRGGFTTGHYGRPRDGVHAVQVEIARRLYMDEHTLARKDAELPPHNGFPRVRQFADVLVETLVREALAAARDRAMDAQGVTTGT
jgi:N-formylglutamate amidohydrolase